MTEQEQIKAMTKDEIKKAFAICCGVQDCTGCPILDMEKQNGLGCLFNLFTRVIDTVSEQEKEIERWRTTLGQCNTELNSALESLKSQCREIGKLKAEVKQAKIDVLIELKQKYGFYICCSWSHATKLLGEIIDEFIERTKNEQDTSNDTARG